MNKCTIIQYHYVHNPSSDFPKVYTKTVEDFKAQLNYVSKNYDVISLGDYVAYLNGQKEISKKTCILTFDDGLSDHYNNVYPILKKLNLPATFFVSTSPLETKQILPVQMLQCLLAEVDAEFLIDEYHKLLKRFYPKNYDEYYVTNNPQKQGIYYSSDWYKPEVINLKCAIGKMTHDMKIKILESLFLEHIGTHDEYCNKLYMTWDNIKEMSENGFEIGSHAVTHSMLTTLSKGELQFELYESKEVIEYNLNKKVNAFSEPWGAYNDDIINEIKKYYNCCVNSAFKVNVGRCSPYNLYRMDTTIVPGGKDEEK